MKVQFEYDKRRHDELLMWAERLDVAFRDAIFYYELLSNADSFWWKEDPAYLNGQWNYAVTAMTSAQKRYDRARVKLAALVEELS